MCRRFALSLSALFLLSCSGLKLDVDSNCLNPQAPCFKNDVTPPQFVSSAPSIAAQYTVLDHIDITFSEEPKNGESTSAYSLSGSGFSAGYQIQYVQKIAQYTYRIFLGGGALQTGNIDISFSGIIDYGGNYLSGTNKVSYQGSSNVPITLSVTYSGTIVNGVSNNGGGAYSNVDISFSHQFTADNANNYSIYLTAGATVCSGTLIGSGTNLAANTSITPINKLATFFPSPLNRIVVCVTNQNNPTATGTASWALIRDDVPPVMANDIPPDSYPTPQTITLTCSDNMDKIAVTSAAQQSVAPAVPVDPGFDAVGNLNGTSNLYTGPITAGNPANPTYTIFSWQCIDKSGNRSALTPGVTKGMQYYIDNTIPAVNLVADPTFRRYIGPANPATNFMFTTDQASKTYNIRRNGTTCTGGGDGTLLVTGMTPATPGTTITQALNTTTHFTSVNTVYPVRICVQGPTLWGTAFVQITRDDTLPVVTPTVVAGTYGAVQSVVFNCTDTNLDKSAYTYSTQLGSIAPAAPFAPTFNTATGAITSINTFTGAFVTPDSSTSVALYACIDLAGNQGSGGPVQYTVDSSIPSVTVVSLDHTGITANAGASNSVNITWNTSRAGTGYSGNNYDIRVGATDCATGSVVASGLTPATANTNVVTNLPVANFPTNGTSYNIKICVKNYAGAQGYQTSTTSVTRDDGYPIYGGLTSLTGGSAGSFTLNWSAATDTGSGVAFYRIYQTTVSGTYAATPDYVVAAPAGSFTVTGLNPATTYYFIAGAVDAAGNETKVAAAEFASKPTIRLVVAGLAGGGSFTITDGASSTTINTNYTAPGSIWITTLGTGQTYNFNITAQPAGQVCAIRELQFGTFTVSTTFNIDCANGYMAGGRFQTSAPALLNYQLYRGNAIVKTSSTTNPNSLATAGGYVYFGDASDCGGGTKCVRRMKISSGAVSIFAANTPAMVRGVASDGSNLYYTTDTPDNALYKMPLIGGTSIQVASGFTEPYAIATDGTYVYLSNRNNHAITRVALATGAQTDLVSGLANRPLGLAVTATDIYFSVFSSHAIFRVPIGGGGATLVYGVDATSGYQDDIGTAALFNQPYDFVYDGADNLFVAENGGSRVRRIRLSTGRVITLAGDGTNTLYQNGVGPNAKLPSPVGITSDGASLYVGTQTDSRIVRLSDLGLVGYWPINPGVNPDDYNSDSATINNGSVSSSLSTATDRFGVAGRASTFSGAQRVFAGDGGLPSGGTARTLCAWIKPSALPAATWAVFAAYGSTVSNQGSGLNLYNGSAYGPVGHYVVFFGYGGGSGTDFAIPYVTSTTQWTHICGSYYSGTATIFINGHKIGAKGGFSWNTIPSGTLNIGQQLTNNQGFNGAISDVRIYNRVLNEGEINELAQDAASAQVGPAYNSGAIGLLAQFDYTATSPASTGPIGSTMTPGCSNPIGKDGDAGGACYLDGTTNMAASGKSIGAPWSNAPRSLCIWFKPASMPSNKVLLAYGKASAQQGFGMTLLSPTQVQLWNWLGSTVTFNYNVQLNTWQHLCGTLAGTTVQMFANGQLIGANTGAIGAVNTVNDNTSVLSMGSNLDGAVGLIFNGTLDDARIYNNVLTPMQVRQLATQVPSGLVARYDFTGDFSDVSGFGQNLTNNGAALANDRFSAANTAVNFSAPAYLNGTMTGFPLGISPRTICAWANPSTLSTTNFSEVAMYGTSSAGWGFGMDAGPPNNGRIFILDAVGDWIYNKPHGLSIWRHICATYDGSTENLYLDGNLLTGVTRGLTTAMGQIIVGRGIFGLGDYFNGNIDDVRVYNRALSLAEIQVLLQQQNKRIYVTTKTYSGNLMSNGGVAGAPTGTTGIAGADAKCNWASDINKPATGTYKAMLGGGVDNLRRACTSASCATGGITESTDWVLRPNITYTRSNSLPIFTANWNGVWDFFGSAPTGGSLTNAIATSGTPWTGFTATWGSDTACGSWDDTGSAMDNKAVFGDATATTQIAAPGGVIYQNWAGGSTGTFVVCGSSAYPLYCVEQ